MSNYGNMGTAELLKEIKQLEAENQRLLEALNAPSHDGRDLTILQLKQELQLGDDMYRLVVKERDHERMLNIALGRVLKRAQQAAHQLYADGDGHAVRALLRAVPELDWSVQDDTQAPAIPPEIQKAVRGL